MGVCPVRGVLRRRGAPLVPCLPRHPSRQQSRRAAARPAPGEQSQTSPPASNGEAGVWRRMFREGCWACQWLPALGGLRRAAGCHRPWRDGSWHSGSWVMCRGRWVRGRERGVCERGVGGGGVEPARCEPNTLLTFSNIGNLLLPGFHGHMKDGMVKKKSTLPQATKMQPLRRRGRAT